MAPPLVAADGRVYLHWQGRVTLRCSRSTTAEAAAAAFLALLLREGSPDALAVPLLRLRDSAGTLLAPTSLLSLVVDGGDLHAVEAVECASAAEASALLEQAAALDAAGRLAASNKLYEAVLVGLGDGSPASASAILAYARNAATAGRHELALSLLRRGVDAHPRDRRLLGALAEALLACRLFADAGRVFDLALSSLRTKGGEERGSRVALAAAAASLRADEMSLLVGRATSLYECGKREEGAEMVMRVLKMSGEQHPAALLLYCRINISLKKVVDAAPALLRLMVALPKSREVKAQLAAAATLKGGVEALQGELRAEGVALAGALSFLALAVRDGGAVEGAVRLLRASAALRPSCPATALALCHAQAACCDPHGGLLSLVSFCRSAGGLGALPVVLDGLKPLDGSQLHWYGRDSPRPLQPAAESKLPKETYRQPELDALACLFTAATLLYAGGAIERARAVCALAQPSADASAVPLHETSVRNEAAYFRCVAAILRRQPPPAPPPAPHAPLYVLGDSHVLSSAWQTVVLRGERRTLVPLLVTGIKGYHLRPGAAFYTRAHFKAAVSRLPPGSSVVTLLGEIDSRTGLLAAVQKGAHGNVEAAAAAVAGWYVDEVEALAQARSLEAYIHPVPPVLQKTRPLVRCLNAALQRRVAASPGLLWLDMGDSLEAAALSLDGTHLSPAYVDLALQPALTRC